jgi:hypothetical protein
MQWDVSVTCFGECAEAEAVSGTSVNGLVLEAQLETGVIS